MERMRGLGLACVCALAVGCSGRLVEDTGQTGASLSTTDLSLSAQAPANGYVGASLTIFQGVYNNDTTTTRHDVTMVSTLVGSFDQLSIDTTGYDTDWACSQDASVKGQVTVTCHADDLVLKDQGTLTFVPNTDGSTITIDTTATEGGVPFGTFHADIPIGTASGVDLSIISYGSGQTDGVGKVIDVPFFVSNQGPLDATGVNVTLSLSGPGKFVNVAPAGLGSCTFTDTTATCPLGYVGVYSFPMLDASILGTAGGTVVVTANVAGDQTDPYVLNNSTTTWFYVYQQTIADLSVSQTATPNPAKFNKALTYSIVATNKGPNAASGAVLSDYLPPDTTFNSVSTTQGSCSGGAYGYVYCDLGGLAANASATVKIVVTPAEGGTISNTASVYDPQYNDIDPDYSNNNATLSVTVQGPNQPVVVTSNEQKYPTTVWQWVDCAHDFVQLTGTMHYSTHSTYNKSSGRLKYDAMNHPENMKGVGMNSGTTYTMTGGYHYSYTFSSLQYSYDYEDVLHLIGKGPGDDLFMHVQNHVVFGSDGTPSVSVYKTSYTCK